MNNQQQQQKKGKRQSRPSSNKSQIPRTPRVRNRVPAKSSSMQVGQSQRTSLTRTGISDIRSHRVSVVMGTIYVGNGTTSGTVDQVYLKSASGQWIVTGRQLAPNVSSGWAPILISDADFGQQYVGDIEKHFARKVIKRMWVHINSLQPTTTANTMSVIAIGRGSSGAEQGLPTAALTAAIPDNTVINVNSCKSSFTVNSWENKTVEITEMIAGGSGPRQNEFDLQTGLATGAVWTTSLTRTALELNGVVPASICVAGTSTGTAFRGTDIMNVVIEQEVDYLDYIGGMSAVTIA